MYIAQSQSYIGHIGSEDGLSSQLCTYIVEDDYGNIWISSFEDIQKYNGYSVTIFPIEERQGDISDALGAMYKDRSGMIWAIQGEKQTLVQDKYWDYFYGNCNINIINPLTDSISSLNDYLVSPKINQKKIVKFFSQKDNLFLGTLDNEIYTYNGKLEFFAKVADMKTIATITPNHEMIFYDNGILTRTDSLGNLIQQYTPNDLQEYVAIVTSSSGKVFLLKELNNQIEIYEYDRDRIVFRLIVDRNVFHEKDIKFTKIERLESGQYWINGQLYKKNENDEYIIQNLTGSKTINDYMISLSGLGYAATNLGVYILDNKKNVFKTFASNESDHNSVRGILLTEDFQAYKIYDKEIIKSKSKKYNLDILNEYDLGYMAYSHYQDPLNKNHLWTVGLLPDGVRKIDLVSQKIESFPLHPLPHYANTILRSSTSSKLYVTAGNGPYIFDENSEEFRKLKLEYAGVDKLVTNHIIEKNNEIWFATNDGIIRYNEGNDTSILNPIFNGKEAYTIQFMHEDYISPNVVWLGTRRGGLVKWDTTNDSIAIWNTTNGLSNNDTHAIIEDSSERLWISTNQYLNCLDKKSNTIYVYTEQDGLSHSEFNKHSHFYDEKENHIYFGGLNGYNYFNPDSIITTSSKRKIDVRIINTTKTKSNGEVENIFQEAVQTHIIDIQEEDVSFEIELSTNYLIDSEKNQYSYRIVELMDSWKSQSSNSIKLNRLPYGKYRLEIISNLSKPALTSNILFLDINVIQPFWKTWLFIISSILLIIFFIWLAFWKYNKNIRERNVKLEETVSLRTKELRDVIKTKNKIFAILSHDLRNPISSLSNLTEKINFLAKNNRMEELNLLAEHTNSRINALNDNLNNVLLWALSENNTLVLNPNKLSLLLEIRKILNIYTHEIEEKEINIVMDLEDIDQVNLDVSLLQTILRNFIKNAINFSYKKGTIEFSKRYENDQQIELAIQDNGIGMIPEKYEDQNLKNKQIRNKGKGSGIGLVISKELINKAGIKLTIESKNSKGTTIRLLMPK